MTLAGSFSVPTPRAREAQIEATESIKRNLNPGNGQVVDPAWNSNALVHDIRFPLVTKAKRSANPAVWGGKRRARTARL